MSEVFSTIGYIALTLATVVAIVNQLKADEAYIAETERLIAANK